MKESRRQFLKKSSCAMGMATIASQMGLMNTLAQTTLTCSTLTQQPSDYKALVLVFLAGGIDGNNMVVPNYPDSFEHPGYESYAAARGDVAIPQNQLQPITVPRMSDVGANPNYGLHPNMKQIPSVDGLINEGLHGLWGAGKMAIVTNVGTLVQPTTKNQYLNSAHPKPRQLFSHSDQIEQHQSAYANGTDYRGWGGRISCKMSPNQDMDLPMMTSIAGSQLFITGGPTPLVVADGNTPLNSLFKFDHTGNLVNPAIDQAFKDIVRTTPGPTTSSFVKQANSITDRAITASSIAGDIQYPELFPNTSIGKQLLQVARIIKLSRSGTLTNPPKRQIFFCQLGGFDTHAYQLPTQANLVYQLSQAVRAFYNEMHLQQQISNSVTTFTMSDFSRTFNPNGNGASAGTDHAWANHMFVIGGSVDGGNFYGVNTPNGTPFPTLSVGDDDDEGTTAARGRWIPTTAVEEYAGVLAAWFGLPPGEMINVFPNYNNFTLSGTRTGNLKFL